MTGIGLSHTSALTAFSETKPWPAAWITYPKAPFMDYDVLHFRKEFFLDQKPENFHIHISADNRYQLFINGRRICTGPARGYHEHWYYETLDIAPFLQNGKNAAAAVVWNYGVYSPVWQNSCRTAFLLQGQSVEAEILNTNQSWKCIRNESFAPIPHQWSDFPGFYALGPGDKIDGRKYPWGWTDVDFIDKAWQPALWIGHGNQAQLAYWIETPWLLEKSPTPPLIEGPVLRHKRIVRFSNINPSNAFLTGQASFTISPQTKASLLLDLEQLNTAYPELIVSGGKGARVKVTYAESLFSVTDRTLPDGKTTKEYRKGNRNETADKIILGNSDFFTLDGSHRLFSPLYWRTWRYAQLDFETDQFPLTIVDFKGRFTAYPYQLKSIFECNDIGLQKIWEIGWHTARICANETFLDCPYYEQLNYSADSRIQALISYTHTSDERLAKRCLLDFSYSIGNEGLTQARAPSRIPQFIPFWSLEWMDMLHDFWMYRGDEAFIKALLPTVHRVISWFTERLDRKEGVLSPLVWTLDDTLPPSGWNGPPVIITLKFLQTLKSVTKMETAFGSDEQAAIYSQIIEQLQTALIRTIDKADNNFANPYLSLLFDSLAVLTETLPQNTWKKRLEKWIHFDGVKQPDKQDDFFGTYYWLYYFHEALKKADLGERYQEALTPWMNMIEEGLTTWAESFPPTRSDCHGWSCSPNIHFLTLICGIEPALPRFEEVRIRPHLGPLRKIHGAMPHPKGLIEISLEKNETGGLTGTIVLPSDTFGRLEWNDKQIDLHPGFQEVK